VLLLLLLQAWAMLEYLDSVLGRLFKHLKDTGLDKSTYVMIMSDNGSFLMPDEPMKVWLHMKPRVAQEWA
jgi:arylsulfatase A-like enzyme